MDAVFTPNLDKLRNIVQSFGANSFTATQVATEYEGSAASSEVTKTFEELLAHLPAGVVMHDARGHVVSANRLALPLGTVVSVGNETQISITDHIDYLAAQDECEAVLLYAESIEDPAQQAFADMNARRRLQQFDGVAPPDPGQVTIRQEQRFPFAKADDFRTQRFAAFALDSADRAQGGRKPGGRDRQSDQFLNGTGQRDRQHAADLFGQCGHGQRLQGRRIRRRSAVLRPCGPVGFRGGRPVDRGGIRRRSRRG